MNISNILNAEASAQIQAMKLDMISSALEEVEQAAVNVAETGDPAYVLELSPMALALFNQASGK